MRIPSCCLTLFICSVFLCLTVASQQASAQHRAEPATAASVKITPTSRHLVPAEMSFLTFKFEGLTSYPRVASIELDQADVFFKTNSAERVDGKIVYYLHYQFQALAEGVYTVPPISFLTNRGKVTSEAVTIHVHSKAKLIKRTGEAEGKSFIYYTMMHAEKSSLFPNETTYVEYKTYLPNVFRVALWGLPLGDKTNCSAWRFATPNRDRLHGKARIDGKTYQAGYFRTNLTALKQGKASIGPLSGRVVFHLSVMDRGFFRKKQFEFKSVSGTLEFDVKSLPPNPPKNFRGDVGIYQMSVATEAPEKITDNDSIQAVVQLKGRGNLATLNPPLLTNSDGWKVISQNRTDLGDDRKLSQGIAEFTYQLQPDVRKKLATETPGFEFVFLHPDLEAFEILKIPGQQIKVESTTTATSPAAGQSNALPYDLFISEPSGEMPAAPWYRSLPLWLIHLIPLGFILYLIIARALRKLAAHKAARAGVNAKKRALRQLEKTDQNFLRAAGGYIEQWVDVEEHPDAKKVLELRDSLCFRPEADNSVSQKRRQKILTILTKASLLMLFCITLQDLRAETVVADSFRAGQRDFAQQQYQPAIQHFLSIPNSDKNPDILFNIGLSHQLDKQPGLAALFYLKALQLNPEHHPAAKNLAYVEDQHNSITDTKLTDIEQWVATFQPPTYLHFIAFFSGVLICLLLSLFILRPRDGRLRVLILLTIFTPILLGVSVYGYWVHPERNSYDLPSYLILTDTELTSEPLETSDSITELPPASRCRLIAHRGSYSYIRLPNGTEGWVSSEGIAPIEQSRRAHSAR